MNFTLNIVPPGGGEADHQQRLSGKVIPRPGEYIMVADVEGGYSAYEVRQVDYFYDDNGQSSEVVVEAEFIEHPSQSEAHKKSIEAYKARGKIAKVYPESGY